MRRHVHSSSQCITFAGRCWFYAGLDDSRIKRLRRSGMTFNKPRGRDTLSLAFESRLRVLPLMNAGDLYGPVQTSALFQLNADDPTSSLGSAVVRKKAQAGDEVMQRIYKQKEQEEAALRLKREWHVLVTHPVDLTEVEEPVAFPSVHPVYYKDWESSGQVWRPCATSSPLERRKASIDGRVQPQQGIDNAPTCRVNEEERMYLSRRNASQLRQNGDTTLIPGVVSKDIQAGKVQDVIRQRFYLSVCVDPFIDVDRFRLEEAQVEMISGYRNILFEAAELPGQSVDVVRIPALACYSCGRRFQHEIAKLSQRSVIKGFHRLSNEAKEKLITNKAFTVELYVPPLLLGQFEQTFLEEAWEAPTSPMNPGRTALYPGLPPPRTLLEYDGWVGKRPELLEAVKTEGRSLLRGPRYNLDGTLVREDEVLSHMRVLGAKEEQQRRLTGEQETARAQLGIEPAASPAPLQSGLLHDHEQQGACHPEEIAPRL